MSAQADLRKLIETITREPITDYHADPDDSNISRPVKLTPVTDEVMQAVNAYITATFEQVISDDEPQPIKEGERPSQMVIWQEQLQWTRYRNQLRAEQRRTLARLTGTQILEDNRPTGLEGK